MLNRILELIRPAKKFNWYDMPMVKRAALANKLGKESSEIMNKALYEARALLEPYGYTMKIDLHFCELPKPEENQAVGQKS